MEILSGLQNEGYRIRSSLAEQRIDARRILGGLSVAALAILSSVACGGFSDNAQVSAWAAKIKEKLQDPTHLSSGERFYSEVKVVAAGETLADQFEMRRMGTPVNVREIPATAAPSGNRDRIIGKIAQGSTIFNVVVTTGDIPNFRSAGSGLWGAFRCDSAQGITWESGKSPKPGDTKICAVYIDYLAAVSSK